MRKAIIILKVLVFFGSSVLGQIADEQKIQNFDYFIGQDKAKALNAALGSFEEFLSVNFSEHQSFGDKTDALLEQLLNNSAIPRSSWNFNTEKNTKILQDWESTGLRSEIWVFGNEEYSPEYNIYELLSSDLDSASISKREMSNKERFMNSIHFNILGQFLYGLTNLNSKNSDIMDYVTARVEGGPISPSLVFSGIRRLKADFDNPFLKRIIIVEVYFRLMIWDMERNGKKWKTHANKH